MDALANLPDSLGIHIDASSPIVRAATALLLLLGVVSASRPFLSLVRVLLSLFALPGQSLSKFGPRGSWALITGASDGIGKEFALALASKGYNLILVSRTQDKLNTLASDITSKYGPKVSTKTFAMDFSRNLDADYVGLQKLADGLDISILVNNVGLSHSIPVPFVETPQKEMTDIIMINCLATLRVTQLITPGMISRKRGLIMTMASFGGAFPTPLLATYSGSKAFLQQWSSALGSELEPHGVHVQCVQSHLVTTAMSKIKRSSALVPNPKQFVRAVLGKVGRSGGAQNISYTSTPYWSHGLMHWFLSSFVGERTKFLVKINRGMHEDIRKRALRKAAREAKNQ